MTDKRPVKTVFIRITDRLGNIGQFAIGSEEERFGAQHSFLFQQFTETLSAELPHQMTHSIWRQGKFHTEILQRNRLMSMSPKEFLNQNLAPVRDRN